MVFIDGAEALLKKLNNVPLLTWEIPEAGIRFEATFVEVLIALFDSNMQLNSAEICTIEDFLGYVKDNISYRECAEEINISKMGWIYNCYEGYGIPPSINPVIGCRSEPDSNGNYSVIFTLDFDNTDGHRVPCKDCLSCFKDFRNSCE